MDNSYRKYFDHLGGKPDQEDYLLFAICEYGWVIPTEEMIELIRPYSPIYSVGASTGYLEWVLKNEDIEIRAFGTEPMGKLNQTHKDGPPAEWYSIVEKCEPLWEIPRKQTLMLSWPPNGDMAHKYLELYKGNTVIYLGGKPHIGGCADQYFWDLLFARYFLGHILDLPMWEHWSCQLKIYERA